MFKTMQGVAPVPNRRSAGAAFKRSCASAGCALLLIASTASVARAQFDSGSDGSDGTLDCAWLSAHDDSDAYPDDFDCATCTSGAPCTFTMNLARTIDGTWDTTPGTGYGVYDKSQWAVVYKFESIDIPANVTVKFADHRSGAPVVWLGKLDVTIAGTINLDGQNYTNGPIPTFSKPGPGGFAGGHADFNGGPSQGLGPGAAYCGHMPGNYGSIGGTSSGYCAPDGPAYGASTVFPLIGGSGGGRTGSGFASGGAGGGAILIASTENITFLPSAKITANGGNGLRGGGGGYQYLSGAPGSGGAIRLVARRMIAGPGTLNAFGGEQSYNGSYDRAGSGRIRLEAGESISGASSNPAASFSLTPGVLFFGSGNPAPTLLVTRVDEVDAPSDPDAGIMTPDVAIVVPPPVTSVIHIEATGIPTSSVVEVRVIPETGVVIVRCPTLDLRIDGSGVLDAAATLAFPAGRSEIQLRSKWNPALTCVERN
jgi:hypothetical protein